LTLATQGWVRWLQGVCHGLTDPWGKFSQSAPGGWDSGLCLQVCQNMTHICGNRMILYFRLHDENNDGDIEKCEAEKVGLPYRYTYYG